MIEILKQRLVGKAVERYQKVVPCGSRRSIWDCFTIEGRSLVLWFNTIDKSTHIVQSEIDIGSIPDSEKKVYDALAA